MGHLINIANNIVTQCEKNNILTSFLKNNVSPECLTRWENLVSVQLVEINKIHQTVMMVCSNVTYISYFFSFSCKYIASTDLEITCNITHSFIIIYNKKFFSLYIVI